MKRNFKLPPPVKAPLGPPPELPSETRNKSAAAALSAGDGPTPAPQAETPLEALLKGRDPRYPFIPPARLREALVLGSEEGYNRIYKIMMFYEHEKEYRMLVQHFGSQHRLYKDTFDYGDQEEDHGAKGSTTRAAVRKNSGRNFYNN